MMDWQDSAACCSSLMTWVWLFKPTVRRENWPIVVLPAYTHTFKKLWWYIKCICQVHRNSTISFGLQASCWATGVLSWSVLNWASYWAGSLEDYRFILRNTWVNISHIWLKKKARKEFGKRDQTRRRRLARYERKKLGNTILLLSSCVWYESQSF